MRTLFVRALVALLALPGMVAFAIPLLIARGPFVDLLGLIPLALGIVLLPWCVRDFYVVGRGTLAPWTPPTTLVATGLYRYSRNPMYVAVSLMLWGWTVGFHSLPLAIYACGIMLMFHLRVVLFEEPWLAGTHGETWMRYRAQVPRWFGRTRRSE